MNVLPRSASTRLALAVMASFLAAFVVLGAGVYVAVSTLLLQDARELVRTDAAGLMELYREEGRGALAQELRDRIDGPDEPDAFYALVEPGGRVELGDAPSVAGGRAVRWTTFEHADADAPAEGIARSRRVLAQLQPLPDGSTLLTGLRLQSQDRFLALMLRTALFALAVAASLGALAGWLTSRWVSRRLVDLDESTLPPGVVVRDGRPSLTPEVFAGNARNVLFPLGTGVVDGPTPGQTGGPGTEQPPSGEEPGSRAAGLPDVLSRSAK